MSLTTLLERLGYVSVPQYEHCDACLELKRYFDRAPTVPLITDREHCDTKKMWRKELALEWYTLRAAQQGLRITESRQLCSRRDREQLDENLLEILPSTDDAFSDAGRMETLERLRYAHFKYAHPSHLYLDSDLDRSLSLNLRGTVWYPRHAWRRKQRTQA